MQQQAVLQEQNKKWEATAKTVMLLGPLDDGLPSADLGTHFDIRTSRLTVGTASDGSDRLKKGEVSKRLQYALPACRWLAFSLCTYSWASDRPGEAAAVVYYSFLISEFNATTFFLLTARH